jgi:hypothetical protein
MLRGEAGTYVRPNDTDLSATGAAASAEKA